MVAVLSPVLLAVLRLVLLIRQQRIGRVKRGMPSPVTSRDAGLAVDKPEVCRALKRGEGGEERGVESGRETGVLKDGEKERRANCDKQLKFCAAAVHQRLSNFLVKGPHQIVPGSIS